MTGLIKGVFSLLLTFSIFKAGIEENANVVEHTIEITHPGFIENEPQKFVIQELRFCLDNTLEYILEVESTICLEGFYKIVLVDLHWDPLGTILITS